MKPTNKDRLILLLIFVVAIYMFFACCYGTYKLFAATKALETEILTEQEQYNKMYAEQDLCTEMAMLKAWKSIEDMSQEEYTETFEG